MPEVVDKPPQLQNNFGKTKPMPVWVLVLIKDERNDLPEIEQKLKISLPLTPEKLENIIDNLRKRNQAVVFRGVLEIVEHYADILKQKELQTRIEQDL